MNTLKIELRDITTIKPYDNNPRNKLLLKPGLALQRLTTREPDEMMLEVAITALERVLAADKATRTTD